MVLSAVLFLIIGMTAVIVIPIVNTSKKIVDRYSLINDKALEKLYNKKFNVKTEFQLIDCILTNYSKNKVFKKIYVDTDDKKVAFVDYKKGMLNILDYSEILGCEILESSALASNTWGLGSSQNVTIAEKCKSMKLVIKTNNIDKPQLVYDIVFGNREVEKGGLKYRTMQEKLQEVKSFFDIISTEKTTKRKNFIYCRYCGAKNHDEALKCESCGSSLK